MNEKLKMRDISQWFFERERELAENERVNELNVVIWGQNKISSIFLGTHAYFDTQKFEEISLPAYKILLVMFIKKKKYIYIYY